MSDMGEIFGLAIKVMIGLAVAAGVVVGAVLTGVAHWLF